MKIKTSPQFKRDLKKLLKKHYDKKKLEDVLRLIISYDSEILKRKHRDHALVGNWQGFRECHIEADWLLIYKIDNEFETVVLVLTRTGSHDTLFSR